MDASSSDEEDGILKKALDVKLPKNFDPQKIPLTGEEYIHHVMYERKQCRSWVSVNINREKFSQPNVLKSCHTISVPKAPSTIAPTLEWQDRQIDDFLTLRKFVAWNLKTDATVEFVHEDQWKSSVFESHPSFSQLSELTQSSKFKLIDMIAQHLETDGRNATENVFVWLYGILATVEMPLSPGNCYDLRKLAECLALIRRNLTDVSECVPFNLLICIIARVFNQIDLADSDC